MSEPYRRNVLEDEVEHLFIVVKDPMQEVDLETADEAAAHSRARELRAAGGGGEVLVMPAVRRKLPNGTVLTESPLGTTYGVVT